MMLRFLFVLILFFGMTVSTRSSNATSCGFDIDDIDRTKLQTDMAGGIEVIYLDLEQLVTYKNENESSNNQTFSKITNQFSKLQKYSLLRWILTTRNGEYMLGYPEDFNADTFNLLEGRYSRRMRFRIKIFPSSCQYDFKESAQNIRKKLLQKLNGTNLPFSICHHFFEKQEWKFDMNVLTGYWLGYSLECFPSNCEDEEGCRHVITKSFISYVLFVIIAMVSLNLPLGFIFLPKRIRNIKQRLNVYQSTDTPYSLARMSLRINEGYDLSESKNKRLRSVPPETRIATSLVIFCFAVSILRYTLVNSFLKDKSEYIDLYGGFDEFDGFTTVMKLEYIGAFICLLFMFYMPYSVLYLAESDNNMYVLYFEQKSMCIKKINIEKLLNDKACECEVGYTKFGYKLLNRMFVLFNLKFYAAIAASFSTLPQGPWYSKLWKYLVLVAVTILNAIMNIPLCVVPLLWLLFGPFRKLFDRKEKGLWIFNLFSCLLGSASILFMYRIFFISTLTFLLKSFTFTFFVAVPLVNVSFKLLAIGFSCVFYLIMFYLEFQAKYKNLLMKCLSLRGIDSKEIPVLTFQRICDHTFPVRYEALTLLIKCLFTSFLSGILLHTISNMKTDKEEFLTSVLPVLVAFLAPAAFNRLMGHDSERDVVKYEDIIMSIQEKEETPADVEAGTLDFACGCGKGVFCGIVSFLPATFIFLLRLVTSCCCPCILSNCWPRCQCELNDNELRDLDEIVVENQRNDEIVDDACSILRLFSCCPEM